MDGISSYTLTSVGPGRALRWLGTRLLGLGRRPACPHPHRRDGKATVQRGRGPSSRRGDALSLIRRAGERARQPLVVHLARGRRVDLVTAGGSDPALTVRRMALSGF